MDACAFPRTKARRRIWRSAAVALTVAASASSAWAQNDRTEAARLRAGEHPGFSRVALDVPRLEDWTLERDGRRLTLTFPGRLLDFDTRQIAPERRISRVSAARTEIDDESTHLILSLACACEATAFEFRAGMLVIDIRPEGDLAAAPASRTPPDRPETADAAAPGPLPPPATHRVAVPEDPGRVSIDEAQSRLLEQLARAADQGLIAFREPATADAAEPASGTAEEAGAPPGAASTTRDSARDVPISGPQAAPSTAEATMVPPQGSAPAPDAPEPVQLDARTAYDPMRPPSPSIVPTVVVCPDAEALDIAQWAGAGDFHRQLAALRGTLVVEFDRPSTETAIALARLYVRHGFGREALQVLRNFAPDAPETPLLADLAAIADGDPVADEGPLAAAESCPGAAALWRIAGGLAPFSGDVAAPSWREDLLGAFAELPVDLRRLTGPALVESLIAAGQLADAEAARRLLDRAPGDHGESWRLTVARLARATGEGEAAERLLTAVAQSDAAEAPEGMLELADLLSVRDAPAPVWLVEDIALAAFRHQGTPLGRRLLTAEVRARAGNNQLAPALDLLASQLVAGRAEAEDVDAARRAVLEAAAAADNGPAAYAAALLDHAPSFGDGPDWDPARLRMAAELTGIGLANAAATLLAPVLNRGGEPALLAAARIDLALGDPKAALDRLDGVAGTEAGLLRADAFEAVGRHADAWREAAPHLPPDAADRAELAWRAGVWAAAAALPTEDPRRDLADWMARRADPSAADAPSQPPDTPASSPPSLARAQGAIDAAGALRRTIERALEDG